MDIETPKWNDTVQLFEQSSVSGLAVMSPGGAGNTFRDAPPPKHVQRWLWCRIFFFLGGGGVGTEPSMRSTSGEDKAYIGTLSNSLRSGRR